MPISPRTQEAYWPVSVNGPNTSSRPSNCASILFTSSASRNSLFWQKSLRRVWPVELELVRTQPRFKLPVILSAPEVRQILSCVAALDQQVALISLYSCGLRLSEGRSIP